MTKLDQQIHAPADPETGEVATGEVVPTAQADPPALDREEVLRYLNLDPGKLETRALVEVCERYGLDPLLKHVVLISGNVYVTRDGLLAIAHRDGHLDGIEVGDVEELRDEEGKLKGWRATARVWRSDMSHAFEYVGRYKASDRMAKQGYGAEMAVKVAEVAALRRAFNVAVATQEEVENG